MLQILISDVPCGHCEVNTRLYLMVGDDGTAYLQVEGCGGFMGRAYESDGQYVNLMQSVKMLKERKRSGEYAIQREREQLREVEFALAWVRRRAFNRRG